MCRRPLHWLMRLVRAAATLGLQNSRRREQHACQLCPPAARTWFSQFLGFFRRDFCGVLLRVSNRRGSPISFLCPLRLRLLFRHNRWPKETGVPLTVRTRSRNTNSTSCARMRQLTGHLQQPLVWLTGLSPARAERRRTRRKRRARPSSVECATIKRLRCTLLAPTHPLRPPVLTVNLRSSRGSRAGATAMMRQAAFGHSGNSLLATLISPAEGRPWPRPHQRHGEASQETRRDHAPATRGRPRKPPATRVSHATCGSPVI